MKTTRVGLIGCGTVGSAVAEFLLSQRKSLQERDGLDIELKKIYTRTPSGPKSQEIFQKYKYLFVDTLSKVIFDKDIDIVVETVGGIGFAYKLSQKVLRAGKHLVTANKAMLAHHGTSLFRLAGQNNSRIVFEASVAGAVPIIRVLSDSLVGGQVSSVCAILNGTSNFILTKMAQEKCTYDEALHRAQELGFAEQDPTEDVEGIDARNKIVILARLAFGFDINPESVHIEGITNITTEDFEYAKEELNSTIKLVAFCNNDAAVYVCPMLIPKNNFLASVNNEFNGISIWGENFQELGFTGLGAGGKATASSVVADIVNVARGGYINCSPGLDFRKSIFDFNNLTFEHTLRFVVRNRMGITADYSYILKKFNLGIFDMSQRRYEKEMQNTLPFLVTLEPAREGDVQEAIKEINQLDFMVKPVMIFRSFV